MKSLVLPEIREFKPYSSARDEFTGGEMIFLDANENPFDDVTYGTINRYPDPHARELRGAIGTLRGVKPEKILVGNGSDELLDLLLRATTRANEDAVVLCPPTYGMYSVLAQLNRLKVLECPLNESFLPDYKAITEATRSGGARIVFLCTPNNPTGNAVPLELIAQIASHTEALVVIDEAYIDFAGGPSAVTLLEQHANIAVLQTFSKAWGLAGLRLGVLFGSTDLTDGINRIKLPYNVNTLTQQIALKRITDPERFNRERLLLVQERTRLQDACRAIPGVREVFLSDANFFLIRVDDATGTYHALLERGVVVRNRTRERGLSGCLRITVGAPNENNSLIKCLQEILR